MKPKRLKVYARLDLISTKLPIVKDLIEIVIHASTDNLEQYEDGSRWVHRYTRRIRSKAETHVKLCDTCKAQGETRKDHKKT